MLLTHLCLIPLLAGPYSQPAKEAVQLGVGVLTLDTPVHGAEHGHIAGLEKMVNITNCPS